MSSAYTATVRQLLDIAPVVFATPHFALKGGTASICFCTTCRGYRSTWMWCSPTTALTVRPR